MAAATIPMAARRNLGKGGFLQVPGGPEDPSLLKDWNEPPNPAGVVLGGRKSTWNVPSFPEMGLGWNPLWGGGGFFFVVVDVVLVLFFFFL